MGCEHHNVQLEILSPCCGRWYACRACHNDCEDHEIKRYLIRKIRCLSCRHIQSWGKTCKKCGTLMCEYFCDKCNAFAGTSEHEHCDKCGICRPNITGMKKYHCDDCGICFTVNQEADHTSVCKKRNVKNEQCSICMDHVRVIESNNQMEQISSCGHMFHKSCLLAWREKNQTCPLCRSPIH